jgi:hypothetical protein
MHTLVVSIEAPTLIADAKFRRPSRLPVTRLKPPISTKAAAGKRRWALNIPIIVDERRHLTIQSLQGL